MPLVVEAGRSVFWSIRVDSCPFVVRFHEQSAVFAGMIQQSCGGVGRDSGTFMRRERGLGASQGKASLCGRVRRSDWFAGKLALAIRAPVLPLVAIDAAGPAPVNTGDRRKLPGRFPAQAAGRSGFEIPTLAGSMDTCHSGTTPTRPASLPEMQPDRRSNTAGPAGGFG